MVDLEILASNSLVKRSRNQNENEFLGYFGLYDFLRFIN